MLKVEPELAAEWILQVWEILGRHKVYLTERHHGLLMLIHNKNDEIKPSKYRPVCMLSFIGETMEKEVADSISATMIIDGRQFGFPNDFSPSITL